MQKRAQRSNGIGGVWDDQLQHKLELECSNSTHQLHDQQLQGIEEWDLDWDLNQYIVCGNGSFGFDHVHLHGGSDGLRRHIEGEFGVESDDVGGGELHSCTERSDGISGVWDDQFQHKLELDGSNSARQLHDQQLHGIGEWDLDWDLNQSIVCGNGSFAFDHIQLHGESDGRLRHVGRELGVAGDDVGGGELHGCTQRSDGIGGVWDDQFQHKLELDGSNSARQLHDHQLHGIGEWDLDWDLNQSIVCGDGSFAFDHVQFHGGSIGLLRHVAREFGVTSDDVGLKPSGLLRCQNGQRLQ